MDVCYFIVASYFFFLLLSVQAYLILELWTFNSGCDQDNSQEDRKKEDTTWEKEKDMSDLSYLQSKAED